MRSLAGSIGSAALARDGQCGEHERTLSLTRKEQSLLPFVRDRIDEEVRTLARCERKGSDGLERRKGLTIERHEPAVEPPHSNREYPRVRHVDEPKPKTLVPGYRPGPGTLAIDGGPVSRPTPMGPVAHRTEALFVDPGLFGEAPVVEEKHFVTVDRRGILSTTSAP